MFELQQTAPADCSSRLPPGMLVVSAVGIWKTNGHMYNNKTRTNTEEPRCRDKIQISLGHQRFAHQRPWTRRATGRRCKRV